MQCISSGNIDEGDRVGESRVFHSISDDKEGIGDGIHSISSEGRKGVGGDGDGLGGDKVDGEGVGGEGFIHSLYQLVLYM